MLNFTSCSLDYLKAPGLQLKYCSDILTYIPIGRIKDMKHHKSITFGNAPAPVPMIKAESVIERIIQWFIYVILIVIAAMVAISFFSKRTDQEAAIGSFDSDTLETGWVLEQNGESMPITLPVSVDAKKDEILIIRNTLPEKLADGSSLMIRAAMEDVYVYINGELRE